MSLGTASLTPLSVARGYAVFANGGSRVDTWLIDRVSDRDGVEVFKENPALACRDCAGTSHGQPANAVVDGFNFGAAAAPAPEPEAVEEAAAEAPAAAAAATPLT